MSKDLPAGEFWIRVMENCSQLHVIVSDDLVTQHGHQLIAFSLRSLHYIVQLRQHIVELTLGG